MIRRVQPTTWLVMIAAVLIMIGVLAWNQRDALPFAGDEAASARQIQAEITVSPHLGEDYTTVTGRYTLLQDWLTDTLDIIAPPTQFIRLEARDREGVLETALGDQEVADSGRFQWLQVPLRSTSKGYTFTVSYDFNDCGTLGTAGNLIYPVREANERTTLTYDIPTSGVQVDKDYTYPAPQSVVQTEDGFRVSFQLDRFRDDVVLAYEPQGGFDTSQIRTVELAVPAGGEDYTFVVRYPAGAEEVAEDVTFFANEIFPVLVEEAGTGPNKTQFDLLLKYQAPPGEWVMATYGDTYPGRITVYLQQLGCRPSLALSHEIAHDYLKGEVPVYVEEGLANILSASWVARKHGFIQYREPSIVASRPFTTTHIMDAYYSANEEEVYAGYEQGADLVSYLQQDVGADLIREMVGILKDERSDLQTVICVSARGQDLYDWLEGHDLIQEAKGGTTAEPGEKPSKFSLHPPGDCTAEEKMVTASADPRTGRQVFTAGRVIGVLVMWVMLLVPLLNLLFGGGLFLFSGLRIMLGGYSFDYVIDHLWLPLVLGLVVGAIIPELLSLVLMGDAARRPAPPSAVEKRRQRRQQVVRLVALYALSMAPAWGLVWGLVFLPAMFPYQASFLGSQWVLMFTSAYVLSAVMTSGVISVRRLLSV